MKIQADRSASRISYLVYILTLYGLLRAVARLTTQLQILRGRYIPAIGAVWLAGLLLVYLPVRLIASSGKKRYRCLYSPGRMELPDHICTFVLLAVLVGYRIWQIPVALSQNSMYVVRINLIFQVIGMYLVYRGGRIAANRLAALGACAAVIFMPSFAVSAYTQEVQSMLLAMMGILITFCLRPAKRSVFRISLLAALVLVLGLIQTDTRKYQILHSLTPAENIVLLVFALICCLAVFGEQTSKYHGCFWLGIPYAILTAVYMILKVPECEQGILHVLLGILSGAAIAHILETGEDSQQEERSREVNEKEQKNMNAEVKMTDADRKKPLPGEYLDNPLPVPKKHVKKEMDYGFEPESDKMFYDITVPEEDDFDLP